MPNVKCPRCGRKVEVHAEGWLHDHETPGEELCAGSGEQIKTNDTTTFTLQTELAEALVRKLRDVAEEERKYYIRCGTLLGMAVNETVDAVNKLHWTEAIIRLLEAQLNA